MAHESHPMIQPTDWSKEPDELKGSMPEDRRLLFKLIWNAALACTQKPPELVHTRVVYQTAAGTPVAFTSVTVGQRAGFWVCRQDFPVQRFTITGAQPRSRTLRVVDAQVVAGRDRPSVARVLEGMEAGRLATPASAARSLHALVEHGWLRLNTDNGLSFALGEVGRKWIEPLRSSGLVGRSAAKNALVASVMDGDTSYRDALTQIFGADHAGADRAAQQIDALCSRWKGLDRLSGLRAARSEAAGVPHHEGLPSWLDPEQQLPADHRWRRLRADMEHALSEANTTWLSRGDADRAAMRLAWLQKHAGQDDELRFHITGEKSRFDAVRYWFTGLKTD